jgi:arsenate reductase
LKTYNILFLCKHNASRSTIGEVLANTHISKKFIGYSAGSEPMEYLDEFTKEIAIYCGHPIEDLRNKSWHEFAQNDSLIMDFIFTVCEHLGEKYEGIYPYWPGNPIIAEWGFDDPSLVKGSVEVKRRAYKNVKLEFHRRLNILASLPMSALTQDIFELKPSN